MNFPNFSKKTEKEMLRTVIVDDEGHVRGTLGKFLARFCPECSVEGEAGSAKEAYEVIQKVQPDLVLLDIQLGDATGFDLLQQFDDPSFKVIFITAHDQFALQAFKVSALDFLLKPVSPVELANAVKKARQAVQHELRIKLEALETNLRQGVATGKRLVIKTLENIHVVNTNSIVCCESDGPYTTILTDEGERIVCSRTIKEYDELLSDFGFYRVHRSYLINLSYIKRFEKQDGGSVILAGDVRIPVASRKRDELLGLFERMA